MDALRDQIIRGRKRSPQAVVAAPAIMRGVIEYAEDVGLWVSLPAQTGEQLHGPIPPCSCGELEVGDRVIVAAVAGSWADLVIIGKL